MKLVNSIRAFVVAATALLLPALTHAQSYTSPTFQNATIRGNLSVAGAINTGGPLAVSGALTSGPITAPSLAAATLTGVGTINGLPYPNYVAPTNIATIAALRTNVAVFGSSVSVQGYYVAADNGGGVFNYNPLDTSSSDNSGTIIVDAANHRWYRQVGPSVSAALFGAVGSGSTVTSTISAASNSLQVSSTIGFQPKHAINVFGAGAAFALNQASGVSIATEGTTGTTTYCARIVPLDASTGYGAATTEVCNAGDGMPFSCQPPPADQHACLAIPNGSQDSNDELVQWTAPSGTTPSSYAVYVGPSGAEVCRAVTVATVWREYGQGVGCPPWLPTAAPSTPNADLLQATIQSIPDSTHFTLSTPAITAVSGAVVAHDDTGPIQAALNATQPIVMPCGTYHITQPLMLNLRDSQQLIGSGKQCSVLLPDGNFGDVVTVAGTTGGTTTFADYLENFEINGIGMASGFCMTLNNTNRPQVSQILLQNCYNEQQWTNVFIGHEDHVFSIVQRRGDKGIYMWGQGGGTQLPFTTQTANITFETVQTASAFQGISFWENGNVVSTRTRYLALQAAPVGIVMNNTVGAGQTPTYGQFYDTGFNVMWKNALILTDATKPEFYSSYLQQANGATNAAGVIISAVDTTQNPVTGVINAQFDGGVYFGGTDVFVDNGTGTIIHGLNAFGQNNSSIRCGPHSTGLQVSAVNTYNTPSNLPIATQSYGLQLDAGCTNANVGGGLFGTVAQVNNLSSSASEMWINGQTDPAPSANVTGSPWTLPVATYPWLYQGGQTGNASIVEVSGSLSPQTLTTDTAANIRASMVNPQANAPIVIIVRNHNHKATTGASDAIVTVVGGTGVTIIGIATIPDAARGMLNSAGNPQAGLYTYRKFVGSINSDGSTITLRGCSLNVGAGC